MDRAKTIAILVAAGHSAEKALEIAVDAKRGDRTAVKWVKHITRRQNYAAPMGQA